MGAYVTVDTYTIEILRAKGYVGDVFNPTVAAAVAEAEENLTDLLPAGYRARIRRWDHPDPDEEGTDDE